MTCRVRLLPVLTTLLAMLASGVTFAQSCQNGNALYHKKEGPVEVSCSQSSCHGADPRANQNHIISGGSLGGGTQAGNIDIALSTVNDMSGVRDRKSVV